MTHPINIRTAHGDDVRMLVRIIRTAHRDVARRFDLSADNCPKHPSNCADDWVRRDLDRGVAYWVLEARETPVGCIALEQANADVCYIERLSVLPERRRNGYGKLLVMHAIDAAGALGAKEIGIGLIAQFTELKRWYQALGFVAGDTREFAHLPFKVLLMAFRMQ